MNPTDRGYQRWCWVEETKPIKLALYTRLGWSVERLWPTEEVWKAYVDRIFEKK
jgi:hypothetical protein